MHISPNLVGKRVAFVGTYIPRRCGIATFTSDLAEAVAGEFPLTDVTALAVSDSDTATYDYPSRVAFNISEQDPKSYLAAAEYINTSGTDLVCLQHEFGIFGGASGKHVMHLLDSIHVPVITTLHTVLRKPSEDQRQVMAALARRSAKFVVMSQKGVDLLKSVFGIPHEKIDLIPHGIPAPSQIERDVKKKRMGLEGRKVLLTFGLMSPDKGIENVIEALPSIKAAFPTVTYVVVGATHPKVKEHSGEGYRNSLLGRVKELGLEGHVHFVDNYVDLDDLVSYLAAADIYITPYLKEEQVTSGTLAIAVGSGRATISTPYWHAQEMLQSGRGILVPFKDPTSIARAACRLFSDPREHRAIERRASEFGESMRWPRVAKRYMRVFESTVDQHEMATSRPVRVNPYAPLASKTTLL